MNRTIHSGILQALFALATVIFALGLCSAAFSQTTETVLENFSGNPNGVGSTARLARDSAGNLYGVSGNSVFQLSRQPNGSWKQTILRAFNGCCQSIDGGNGPAGVILDAAGNLYGTTFGGGIINNCQIDGSGVGCGVVFELSPSTTGKWKETVLHAFTGGADGAYPAGGLAFDAAGNLYGTTEYGGNNTCQSEWYGGCGVVFKLSPQSDGKWKEHVLQAFTGGSDGSGPYGNVIFDQAGNLYSTTLAGGNNSACPGSYYSVSGCGVVFELSLTSSGWIENVLYTFAGQSDGDYPLSGVVMDAAGNLFGEAQGGAQGFGVAFELSPSSGSWTETILTNFTAAEAYPKGGLTIDPAGNLFGTVSDWGVAPGGEVFELSPAGGGTFNYSVVHSFTGVADGGQPWGALILDASGNLYGTTLGGGGNGCYPGAAPGCGLAFEISKVAGTWQETVLYDSYAGGAIQPISGVVADASGNFYGTTSAGGEHAWGTIYETSPAGSGWTTKVIYHFTGGVDGGFPIATLTIDAAGNLYGTTQYGASANCSRGCGTVFKLSPAGSGQWRLSVLHQFQGGNDGYQSMAGVILDGAGNLYGTTRRGGDSTCNCGTVFELSPAGTGWHETILHRFRNLDGSTPLAGLVLDSNGNLYGTTELGGSCNGGNCGVAFAISTTTHTFSLIHTFASSPSDGQQPVSGLIMDSLGNLYGVAQRGPTAAGGMVFELTPSSGGTWQETVLVANLSPSNGPFSGLTADSHGNFFGSVGGNGGAAMIFELIPNSGGGWTEQTYFTFNPPQSPSGGNLLLDAAGNLYGTSLGGGTGANGVLYKISP